MLRVFGPGCSPSPINAGECRALPSSTSWIDLFDPTSDEERLAEQLVGKNIPTREELAGIEPSSRLYQSHGGVYMTLSVIYGVSEGHPASDPVGFILTDKCLVSIRYIDPKPFVVFAAQVQAEPDLACHPSDLLVRLVGEIVGRLADELQAAGTNIDAISHEIFAHRTHGAQGSHTRRLDGMVIRIGKVQQLLAKLRETSVSTQRLLTFFASIERVDNDPATSGRVRSLVADTEALNDHSNFLTDNITFLLDASLGFVSLEQATVMKIFSIIAVVLMPPTLITGIYGMNFVHMPELRWLWGYPFALMLVLISAVVPAWIARRRGWL